MNFIQKLEKIVRKNNSLVCVGLDSDLSKLAEKYKKQKYPQFTFNKAIIEKTCEFVCAYKPNSAFYEARGEKGVRELKMTFDYLRKKYPEIATILDAKRGDIESTNRGYVQFIFDYLGADAVTLSPYLGREALKPFLERKDKGCIILCRTSNPGAAEFQDLKSNGKFLFEQIAEKVVKNWNKNNNCLLVVGATYPEEMKKVREAVGESFWFLVPGVGSQGGDLEKTIRYGQNKNHLGLIISSSRGIIFSENPTVAARNLQNTINQYRS